MRIREIRIDGFGRFAGAGFGPLDGPLTVFLGPNEAGKSTLMEFVRTVLFGFRPRAGRTPRGGWPSNYPPLSGGSHGGSLTLVGSDGRTSVVSRSHGGRTGRLSVSSEAGDELGEAALAGLLGNHSRVVFERIFAFALDELHSPDLLSDENVNGQIYSAGMGATSLPGALKSLDSRRRAIFLKGGSSQAMHGVGARLGEIDGRLAEVAGNAASYGALTARLAEIESEFGELGAGQAELRSRLARQEMLRRGWNDWNATRVAESELAELEVIDDFPADGVGRLDAVEQRVEIARAERDSARETAAEVRRRAQVPIEHGEIADRAADIRRVREGRGAYEGSIGDLPEREAELEAHRRAFAESLKDLGPDWDEDRLDGFDLSIAVRQHIEEHGARLRVAADHGTRSDVALQQARDALDEAIGGLREARAELESSPDPGVDERQIEERRRAVIEVRAGLDAIERRRQSQASLRAQLDALGATAPANGRTGRSIVLAAGALIVGAGLLVAGAVLGGSGLYLGLASGMAFLAGAAYLFATGRSGSAVAVEGASIAASTRLSHRRLESEISELGAALARDAETLGMREIAVPALVGAEKALEGLGRRLAERRRLASSLRDAETLTARRRERVEACEAAAAGARRDLEEARCAWRGWLADRGLLDRYTPGAADALRGQVELCRSRLNDVRMWEHRVEAIEEDIDEYRQVVEPLAADFGIALNPVEHRAVAAAADGLVEIFERVRREVANREGAGRELEEAESRLKGRGLDLDRAQAELRELLERGGADTAEEFRVRAARHEERAALARTAKDAMGKLQGMSGPGEEFRSFRADLAETDINSIEDAIGELGRQLEAIDGRREELASERGSVESDLRGLTGEEESSRLRMERGVLIEQMRAHAREWSRLTIALGLLEEARAKFERERQPGVVRHAQGFFEQITGGRYRQLYAPLGEQTITVTDADGRTKQPAELSRGTREQLFLSLRFGLVRELGEATEPLPVVVDEVLVNFDPERARRAAGAFIELSRTNQVLVFTCQPQVVDQFRGAAADAGAGPPAVLEIG